MAESNREGAESGREIAESDWKEIGFGITAAEENRGISEEIRISAEMLREAFFQQPEMLDETHKVPKSLILRPRNIVK